MITHLMSDTPQNSNLCHTWITGDNYHEHSVTSDVTKADCGHCVGKYNNITQKQEFAKVVDVEYRDIDHEVIFLLEDSRDVIINVRDLAGPGVWRRVLWYLELNGGKDIDHLMLPDYTWSSLVGEWHY